MAYPSEFTHGDDANLDLHMDGTEDFTMDHNDPFGGVDYGFSRLSPGLPNPNFLVSAPEFSSSIPAFPFSPPNSSSLPASSRAEQQSWMQSIVDIFDLSEESEPEEIDDDGEPVAVDVEAQNHRTERLKSILPALDRLWWANSDFMAGAAEKLADGSRDRRSNLYFLLSNPKPLD